MRTKRTYKHDMGKHPQDRHGYRNGTTEKPKKIYVVTQQRVLRRPHISGTGVLEVTQVRQPNTPAFFDATSAKLWFLVEMRELTGVPQSYTKEFVDRYFKSFARNGYARVAKVDNVDNEDAIIFPSSETQEKEIITERIKGYLVRYKHETHDQSTHGNRKFVPQEKPGGRAAGGVFTVGMNEETYRGGQFLPTTALKKMYTARKKVDQKYATEEEKYLNTKQQVAPYKWEYPPNTNSKPISSHISGTTNIPTVMHGNEFAYDIDAARKITPNPVSTGNGYRQRTPQEWEDVIQLAIRFNKGERWFEPSPGPDYYRAMRKRDDMIKALTKTGATQEEIELFLKEGQTTKGKITEFLITEKHLMGQHPQSRHGWRGGKRGEDWSDKIKVPRHIIEITSKLHNAGYQAVVVGGAVRDSMLGLTPHDWDIASSATPEQVAQVFGKDRIRSNAGESHGTILVLAKNGEPSEITTFRRDVESIGGRYAVVAFSGLADDLMRRDVTVNALAFEPATGKLYGPSPDLSPDMALQDLRNRVARFVGDGYARITEDRLRAPRLPRIARKMNGTIAPESAQAVQEAVKNGEVPGDLSGERLAKELLNILRLPNPEKAVQMWDSLGLTDAVIPEIKSLRTQAQNVHHGKNTVWQHTLEAIEDLPRITTPYKGIEQLANMLDGKGADKNPGSLLGASRALLALATMLHDTGKPETAQWKDGYGYQFLGHEVASAKIAERVAKRLRLDSNSTKLLVAAVNGHMGVPDITGSDKSIRKWLRSAGDNAQILMDIRHADATRRRAGTLLTPARIAQATTLPSGKKINPMPVSGIDVMNMLGIKPGPQVGQILKRLEELYDENPAMSREDLLKLI